MRTEAGKVVRTGVYPGMSMLYEGCCRSHSPSSLFDTAAAAASSSSRLPDAKDLVLGLCSGTVSDLWARADS